jgi:hypothetical protein
LSEKNDEKISDKIDMMDKRETVIITVREPKFFNDVQHVDNQTGS